MVSVISRTLVDLGHLRSVFFSTSFAIGRPANDAPLIRYKNFKFARSSYNKAKAELSCSYNATRYESGEEPTNAYVSLTNVGDY